MFDLNAAKVGYILFKDVVISRLEFKFALFLLFSHFKCSFTSMEFMRDYWIMQLRHENLEHK